MHSNQKVSSRLTLFDITREMFNQNCLFKMQRMQNFHTHILSGYSLSILTTVLWNLRNLWHQVQEKSFVTFCQYAYGASMHDNEITAQNSMHTVGRPWSAIGQKYYFFPSTQLNKTYVSIIKSINCKEWRLKCA